MKLTKSGPKKDEAGEFISELIEESDDLEQLQKHGVNIAKEMGAPEASWVCGPIAGSNRIANAKNLQLEISESCFLGISDS